VHIIESLKPKDQVLSVALTNKEVFGSQSLCNRLG
jgi:hypothetical protein